MRVRTESNYCNEEERDKERGRNTQKVGRSPVSHSSAGRSAILIEKPEGENRRDREWFSFGGSYGFTGCRGNHEGRRCTTFSLRTYGGPGPTRSSTRRREKSTGPIQSFPSPAGRRYSALQRGNSPTGVVNLQRKLTPLNDAHSKFPISLRLNGLGVTRAKATHFLAKRAEPILRCTDATCNRAAIHQILPSV